MINLGPVPASSVLPIPFASYGKTNGESITLTGLAVTDIEVYKGTSMTQRSSDNGYSLIDTDGIDIDSVIGLHGFSIDLSDNSDASFYSVGSFFTVVVSTVTVDSQAVSFIAATFRIVAAESIAGKPKVDVDAFGGSAGTFASGIPAVNTTQIEGSDATNQIRDSVVDDATRIDASALNTLSSHDPGETIMGATDLGTGSGFTSLATAAELAKVPKSDGTVVFNATAVAGMQSGLSTLTQANVRAAVGLASANLDSQLDALPTAAENATAVWANGTRTLSAFAFTVSTNDVTLATSQPNYAPAKVSDVPTAAQNADAVWDEALSGHQTAGSAGKELSDAEDNASLSVTNTQTLIDDSPAESATTRNKIADHVRRRTQQNVENSEDGDPLSLSSEYGFIQQAQKSNTTTHAGQLTVFKTDGITELGTLDLSTDPAAEPTTGVE